MIEVIKKETRKKTLLDSIIYNIFGHNKLNIIVENLVCIVIVIFVTQYGFGKFIKSLNSFNSIKNSKHNISFTNSWKVIITLLFSWFFSQYVTFLLRKIQFFFSPTSCLLDLSSVIEVFILISIYVLLQFKAEVWQKKYNLNDFFIRLKNQNLILNKIISYPLFQSIIMIIKKWPSTLLSIFTTLTSVKGLVLSYKILNLNSKNNKIRSTYVIKKLGYWTAVTQFISSLFSFLLWTITWIYNSNNFFNINKTFYLMTSIFLYLFLVSTLLLLIIIILNSKLILSFYKKKQKINTSIMNNIKIIYYEPVIFIFFLSVLSYFLFSSFLNNYFNDSTSDVGKNQFLQSWMEEKKTNFFSWYEKREDTNYLLEKNGLFIFGLCIVINNLFTGIFSLIVNAWFNRKINKKTNQIISISMKKFFSFWSNLLIVCIISIFIKVLFKHQKYFKIEKWFSWINRQYYRKAILDLTFSFIFNLSQCQNRTLKYVILDKAKNALFFKLKQENKNFNFSLRNIYEELTLLFGRIFGEISNIILVLFPYPNYHKNNNSDELILNTNTDDIFSFSSVIAIIILLFFFYIFVDNKQNIKIIEFTEKYHNIKIEQQKKILTDFKL